MNPSPFKSPISSNSSPKGFALVIALSLMAFIVVLLLSITTLVRVETSASETSLARVSARQNALLGAYLALGELQAKAGPDQRITARASILGTGADESKHNFTGVWSSDPADLGSQLSWLASDWDSASTNYSGYAATASPGINKTPSDASPSVALVNEGSVDLGADAQKRAIRVSLEDTKIKDDRGDVGAYGWWVSDENTKSSVRGLTPVAPGSANTARYQSVLSLSANKAANLGTLPSLGGSSVDPNDLLKLTDMGSVELVGYDKSELKKYYHDYTVSAFGVVANVKEGGLKKDLSLAFEMRAADFNSSEFAAGASDSVPVLGTGPQARPIFYDANGGRGPSWHLLRDYYTIYQRMENPLTNPTFPAQHFRPNHEDMGFPGRTNNHNMAAGRFDNSGVWNQGVNGDPLLSDSLPYLVRANYMPYVQRWTNLITLDFKDWPNPTWPPRGKFDYHQAVIRQTLGFVVHNPYNVKVEHWGFFSVVQSFFNLELYSSLNPKPPTRAGRALWTKLSVPSGTLSPGESTIFDGVAWWKNGTWSKPGVPLVEEIVAGSGFDVNFPVAYEPGVSQPNLEVKIVPQGGNNYWRIEQTHSTGSPNVPITIDNWVDQGERDFNYAAYIPRDEDWKDADASIFDGQHFNWLGRSNVEVPMDTTQHVAADGDAPKPVMMIDNYLKPTDADYPYPTHTLANPHAPMRTVTNSMQDGDGYPIFAPAWQLEVKNPTVAAGQGLFENNGDSAYWGDSLTASGSEKTAPLELPVVPPTSIGHLQSANLSTLGTMPALAVGNSFAPPYLARDEIVGAFNNIEGQRRLYHDLSYHLNEALWDDYFFSSYSVPYNLNADDFNSATQPGDSFDAAFEPGYSNAALYSGSLPNPRMRLLLGDRETLDEAKDKLFDGSGQVRPATGVDRAAENLLVEGAFNVHSTSVDAWASILAAGRGEPIYRSSGNSSSLDSDKTAVSRTVLPAEEAFTGNNTRDDAAWSGYRALDDDQIRELAENIVAELKDRVENQGSPFLSLGAFVNRSLSNDDFGLAGLIQAAIDRSDLNQAFESTKELTASDLSQSVGPFPNADNVEKASGGRAAGSSAAAHINQADILQGIGSFIQVRSDTFRIRSYGDVRDPVTGEVRSQVWCEMLVQRVPEPVYPSASDPSTDLFWVPDNSNGDFGRRFEVISVKFLDAESV